MDLVNEVIFVDSFPSKFRSFSEIWLRFCRKSVLFCWIRSFPDLLAFSLFAFSTFAFSLFAFSSFAFPSLAFSSFAFSLFAFSSLACLLAFLSCLLRGFVVYSLFPQRCLRPVFRSKISCKYEK